MDVLLEKLIFRERGPNDITTPHKCSDGEGSIEKHKIASRKNAQQYTGGLDPKMRGKENRHNKKSVSGQRQRVSGPKIVG